jgi:hypothetical protein
VEGNSEGAIVFVGGGVDNVGILLSTNVGAIVGAKVDRVDGPKDGSDGVGSEEGLEVG